MSSTPNAVAAIPRSTRQFQHRFFIEAFGVQIGFCTTSPEAVAELRKMLVIQMADTFREIDQTDAAHRYFYVWNKSGRDSLYADDGYVSVRRKRDVLINSLGSLVRLKVAEFAVGRVFIHAGAVAWKGKGIIIPGTSFSGKSTLTAELVRRGAEYYSDEYAVIDENGLLEPFAKMLSIRGEIDERTQVEHPVESFGGKAGTAQIPIGLVVVTEFRENAKWKPRVLSSGQGLMEIIKNTVPIRYDPTFALRVLNEVAKNSVIVKSKRGDAAETAVKILDYL